MDNAPRMVCDPVALVTITLPVVVAAEMSNNSPTGVVVQFGSVISWFVPAHKRTVLLVVQTKFVVNDDVTCGKNVPPKVTPVSLFVRPPAA